MALTTQSVREYVTRQLGQDGSAGVKVELTPPMIDDCIAQALRIYNRYCARRVVGSLTITAGTHVYDLDDLSLAYGKGVVDVVPKPLMNPNRFDLDIFNPYAVVQAPMGIGGLASDIEQLRLARQVTGSEFDWMFDENDGALYITASTNITQVAYTYLVDRTVGQVRVDDEDWFLRFVTVLAKYPLGRMRKKYGTVRGSEHELQLDGDSLLSEHADEKDPLIQELRNRTGEIGVPIRG